MAWDGATSRPIIFDIGLHTGGDTDFYLRKGFDVVAVECHPGHLSAAKERFKDALAQGRLTIVDAAIAPREGPIEFYQNLDKDDWGSIDPHYGARDGTRHQIIRVQGRTFADIYRPYMDRVYSIKCDIEGGDIYVLQGLLECPVRPKYFSIEAHSLDYLAYLRVLGYTKFKLVNQNLL